MSLLDTFALAVDTAHLTTTKKELLIDIHKFIGPKFVLVQDVCREDFCCHTAGKIFNALTRLNVSWRCSAPTVGRTRRSRLLWTNSPRVPLHMPSLAAATMFRWRHCIGRSTAPSIPTA